MSRAEYDRQRAEYIKSHSRAERLRLAWLMAAYVHRNRSTKPRVSYSKGFHGTELRNAGYDLPQVNAFCDSVHAGLTASTLQRFARYAATAFYLLQRYMVMSPGVKVWMRSALHGLPPIENAGATLRAAFREAEHALIELPRVKSVTNKNDEK